MASAAQQHKIRRAVLMGAIVAITVAGAWYGAELKTQQDNKKMIHKRREATPDEKLAQLEKQRSTLVAKKIGLEKKLQDLDSKMAQESKR